MSQVDKLLAAINESADVGYRIATAAELARMIASVNASDVTDRAKIEALKDCFEAAVPGALIAALHHLEQINLKLDRVLELDMEDPAEDPENAEVAALLRQQHEGDPTCTVCDGPLDQDTGYTLCQACEERAEERAARPGDPSDGPESDPLYRSQMRDAGRGHQLP